MHESEPLGAQERVSARTTMLWWLIWMLWVPLIIPLLASFLATHPTPARAVFTVVGTLLFFATYAWTTRRAAAHLAGGPAPAPSNPLARWAPIALMLALAASLTLWDGLAWGDLFIFTCTSAAGWLPLWEALGVTAGVIAYEALGLRGDLANAANAIAFTLIPAAIVLALVRSIESAQQVRGAREELARLAAVTEERLRIARDLHDLLGHNLSVIALKSELARRLVLASPERAAVEIGDVEAVARGALREVREAVAGYRQPSLASELAGAREILVAAGVTVKMDGAASVAAGLSTSADAALAWVLREGVTNVVRHAQARSCTMHLARTADEVVLEIENDGRRASGTEGPRATGEAGGNGLRGAAERMEALGGRFEAGPRGDRFRLRATLPLARDVDRTAASAKELRSIAVSSSLSSASSASSAPSAVHLRPSASEAPEASAVVAPAIEQGEQGEEGEEEPQV